MTWTFSDGTVVHLGGKVEGESILAKFVRRAFDECRAGRGPMVDDGPAPGPMVRLDVNNAHHLAVWLENTANCLRVGVVSAPEVPDIEGEPVDVDGLPVLF